MEWCQDDKDTFERKYQEFLNNNDYLGARDYIKSFNVDKQRIPQVQNLCRQLEEKSYEYNMVMHNPYVDKDLIKFRSDYINGNSLADKPGPYKEFCDYINALTDSDGKIRIDIEGTKHKRYGLFGIDELAEDESDMDDALDLFKTQLGLSSDPLKANSQLASMGISIGYNTSHNDYGRNLEIDSSNSDTVVKVLKALVDTNTNHSLVGGRMPLDGNPKNGEYRWKFKGDHTINLTSPSALTPLNTNFDETKDATIEEKNVALSNILDLVDRAEEEYNKALGTIEDRRVTMPVQKLGMRTASLQHIEDLYANNMLDNEHYKNYKARDEQAIMDHIRSANYTNYEVYGNDVNASAAARGVLHKLTDDEKYPLRDLINYNIKNGKEVVYEMGRRGDQIGLIIGLADKENEDSDEKMYREFFVVDFTKDGSDYDDALYNDNKTIAATDMGRMLIHHTPLDVSKSIDGTKEWLEPVYDEENTDYTTVKHFTQHGNSPATMEYISVDEAQNLRNRKIIIDRCIDKALRSNYDPNGNFSPNRNMDFQIERVVDSALYELFPEWMQQISVQKTLGLDSSREEEFLKEEKNELLTYIKNSINLLIEL